MNLLPGLGPLGVVFLMTTFAPEACNQNVPEAIDATHFNRGIICPLVATVESLASALDTDNSAAVSPSLPSPTGYAGRDP